MDRQDTINFRRRRCRTESVEGVTRVGAVRHLRCRREEWSSLHGFTLALLGHHPRLSMVCPLRGQWVRAGRFLFSLPLHFSTGSPFGHHPRLRMVCPLWGQWMSTRDTQLNSIPAYRLCSCGYSRSLLRRSPLSHILSWYVCLCGYPHCISSASTSTQSNASGGGALCLTAGDTRAKARGNPWTGRLL